MIHQLKPTDIYFKHILGVYCCIVEQYDRLTYNSVNKIFDQSWLIKYKLYSVEDQYRMLNYKLYRLEAKYDIPN